MRPPPIPACQQDNAKVAVAIGLIWRKGEAFLQKRNCFVVPPVLMREHAGIMERARVIGGCLDHAAIHLRGLPELLIFLQQNCKIDRLVERQLARRRL
jgi:hypothetical protein